MDMRAHIDLGSMDFTARVSGGQVRLNSGLYFYGTYELTYVY